MKRKTVTSLLLFSCLVIYFSGTTTSLSGKWVGTVNTPMGIDTANFTFKVENGKLTGTASTPIGDTDLDNGVSDGTNFSFSIGENGEKLIHKGKYYADGDSVSMTMDAGTFKMPTTLKRLLKNRI